MGESDTHCSGRVWLLWKQTHLPNSKPTRAAAVWVRWWGLRGVSWLCWRLCWPGSSSGCSGCAAACPPGQLLSPSSGICGCCASNFVEKLSLRYYFISVVENRSESSLNCTLHRNSLNLEFFNFFLKPQAWLSANFKESRDSALWKLLHSNKHHNRFTPCCFLSLSDTTNMVHNFTTNTARYSTHSFILYFCAGIQPCEPPQEKFLYLTPVSLEHLQGASGLISIRRPNICSKLSLLCTAKRFHLQ